MNGPPQLTAVRSNRNVFGVKEPRHEGEEGSGNGRLVDEGGTRWSRRENGTSSWWQGSKGKQAGRAAERKKSGRKRTPEGCTEWTDKGSSSNGTRRQAP